MRARYSNMQTTAEPVDIYVSGYRDIVCNNPHEPGLLLLFVKYYEPGPPGGPRLGFAGQVVVGPHMPVVMVVRYFYPQSQDLEDADFQVWIEVRFLSCASLARGVFVFFLSFYWKLLGASGLGLERGAGRLASSGLDSPAEVHARPCAPGLQGLDHRLGFDGPGLQGLPCTPLHVVTRVLRDASSVLLADVARLRRTTGQPRLPQRAERSGIRCAESHDERLPAAPHRRPPQHARGPPRGVRRHAHRPGAARRPAICADRARESCAADTGCAGAAGRAAAGLADAPAGRRRRWRRCGRGARCERRRRDERHDSVVAGGRGARVPDGRNVSSPLAFLTAASARAAPARCASDATRLVISAGRSTQRVAGRRGCCCAGRRRCADAGRRGRIRRRAAGKFCGHGRGAADGQLAGLERCEL
jgi:hypothetical protein